MVLDMGIVTDMDSSTNWYSNITNCCVFIQALRRE